MVAQELLYNPVKYIWRYERGHFYFKRAAADAQRIGAPFAWQLREVPGAGHENEDMAPAAAEVLKGR